MGAAAASANVCVKPVVLLTRVGQEEGEGGTMQMCQPMLFAGAKEPARALLVGDQNHPSYLGEKQPSYLGALLWKFVK